MSPSKRGFVWGHPAFGAGTYHHPITSSAGVVKYTVQEGDTLFGIAEKFGLKPETILWGNYYVLLDDPHALKPGQELNILPVNGTYHEWQQGEGLNGVAKYYGVTPEDIINYPANNLDACNHWRSLQTQISHQAPGLSFPMAGVSLSRGVRRWV